VPEEGANTDPGTIGNQLRGRHQNPLIHERQSRLDDGNLAALAALPSTI
jgi:hypothetical protein